MRLIAPFLLWAFVQSASPSYPPPYPREGTRAPIDNQPVQVWDVTWPKGVKPGMHRHLYDMTGIYYWPGARLITATDGSKRDVSTPAGRIQWQLKGITHIEGGRATTRCARWTRSSSSRPSGLRERSSCPPAP